MGYTKSYSEWREEQPRVQERLYYGERLYHSTGVQWIVMTELSEQLREIIGGYMFGSSFEYEGKTYGMCASLFLQIEDIPARLWVGEGRLFLHSISESTDGRYMVRYAVVD